MTHWLNLAKKWGTKHAAIADVVVIVMNAAIVVNVVVDIAFVVIATVVVVVVVIATVVIAPLHN